MELVIIRNYQVNKITIKILLTVYSHYNNLNTCEANIVKYITRHNKKGEGKEDILKVIHYAQLLLELDYPEEDKQQDLFNDLIDRGRHVQIKS